ncbi:MAG: pantoate--beta-alanine ligase [Burkholderiales bacterium]|nr:pantoate--beta-alanine ligase [Burkholderiales bacterium]
MDVIHTVAELRARLAHEPGNALVPTMGNLHEGHIRLVESIRPQSACTVVSIFVNRLQFGPREDFDKYPRTFASDCAKLAAAGCDVVFAPDEAEIYPEPQTYTVEPPEIANILDGAVRPGHFRGVATVVLKLFNMVAPRAAIFGKKDYQQCIVLNNMARQLALPIRIILAETVRAPDGLALSSRNGYLSAPERAEAPQLHATLLRVATEVHAGKRDYRRIELSAMAHLAERGWQPDYVAIRRRTDLMPPLEGDAELVVLGAAKLGATRLIDNLELAAPA